MKKSWWIVLLALAGCIEEDFFGLSPHANIREFEVSNQASPASIDSVNKEILLAIPGGIDITNITLNKLVLSSFATADAAVGDVIDLSEQVSINVTSESGNLVNWVIDAEVANSNVQLPNTDFNLWYQSAEGYFEPGEDAASTIWGTGNPGSNLIGQIPTTPLELSVEDRAVHMETKFNGNLAAAFGTPISAATIFTGTFNKDNIDPSDPRAAIEFGTPFAGRPVAFRINYSYVPGASNEDKNGNPLGFGDMCDIYLLLELRIGGEVSRLGTAWFRSGDTVEETTSLEVPVTYGPLDDSFPAYQVPANGEYVEGDSASFVLPSHLIFVASSSFDGDNFAGAVGSTLIINDLELVYEE